MSGTTIYGAGLSFPLRIGGDGRLAWSREEENVRECLRVLLTTSPGERVMREEFGCGLRRYLGEPMTPTTRELVRRSVEAAVKRWEPRVSLQEVSAAVDADDPSKLHVGIVYELNATGALEGLEITLTMES